MRDVVGGPQSLLVMVYGLELGGVCTHSPITLASWHAKDEEAWAGCV